MRPPSPGSLRVPRRQENSPPVSSLKAARPAPDTPSPPLKKLLKINDIGVIDMKLIATNSIKLGEESIALPMRVPGR